MPRFSMIGGVVLIVAALVGGIAVQQHRLDEKERRIAELALGEVNRAALHDTTREVGSAHREMDALLGDSLKLVERLVTQRTQERDAVDRSLGSERIARYRISARVDSLQAILFAAGSIAAEGAQDTRRASFNVRHAPYTVSADVTIPRRPDSASLSLAVTIDSIVLDARVSCDPPNQFGIRAASLAAIAPSWSAVRFDHVEQTSDLCNGHRARGSARSRFGLMPLFVGAGRVYGSTAGASWGLFVGAGYGFVPRRFTNNDGEP